MSAPDLEVLRRSEPAPAAVTPPRGRPWLAGAALVVAAAAVYLVLLPVVSPHRVVRTAAVRIETGAAARAATAAEATGWIEPSPFPTVVRPLVDGVVESIDVLEGQEVAAGKTVVARLRNFEKEVALERAEASLAHRRAHVGEVRAQLDEARWLREQRLDLRAEVARLEGEAAVADKEAAAARADVAAADARVAAAEADLRAQQVLAEAGTVRAPQIDRARAEVASVRADASAKRAAAERAEAAHRAFAAQAEIAREGLRDPRALEGAVHRYQAHLAAAEVEAKAQEVEVGIARREVALLTVVAPVDGVVLRRESAPGSVVGPGVMPTSTAGEMDADSGVGGVVSLYDPRRLQARILVQPASAAAAGVGREVELSADTVPDRVFRGKVIRVQPEVDVRLPLVEVKVSVDDPDPRLQPGGVVRARFLARASSGPGGEPPAPRVLVPKGALRGDAVFVVDPRGGGRARRVPVVRVAEDGEWVEVRGDVSATHRVILDEVHDGDRVKGDAS